MKHGVCFSLVAGLLLAASPDLSAVESAAKAKPGIKRMQLVTNVSAVTPGEPFTVALVIDPLPAHHTYWRGPGIVGMATTLDWTLPPGFSAGDLMWPAPRKVLMAGITAYGYRSRTLLLTEIRPPAAITGENVTLKGISSWMACAKVCNPGTGDFSLTLPVNRTGKPSPKDALLSAEIEKTRESVPRPAPASWKISARSPAADRIELDISIPGLADGSAESVYFYCYDMQVDSDKPQQVNVVREGGKALLRLTLVRPDCAPRSPATIAGVLHRADGWPAMDAKDVEISAPWPDGTFGRE